MRIKQLHTFIGFTIFGLFVQSGLADISLTLRNGAQGRGSGPGFGRNRKGYLPPPVQAVQHNTEKYYRIQEEHQQQHQGQFQESNYGNARYQIFEVHNHYEPASKHQHAAPQAVVRIKHINSGVVPSHNHLNDDHLDISYLSFAANDGPNGEQITIHEQLPPPPRQSLPVPQIAPIVPVPFQSNSQHNFQKTHGNAGVNQGHSIQAPEPFKGPDYLPPNRDDTAIHPAQQLNREPFKGPDYLPPHQGVAPHPAQQYLAPQISQQQHTANAHHTNNHNEYKGPDYLPPHHNAPIQAAAYHGGSGANAVSGAYRGPDYLPPNGGSQVQQSQLQSFHQQQTPSLNIHPVEHHQQQTAGVSSVFDGPDSLPPHQEISTQQHLPLQPFQGPDYLPPHATNVAASQLAQHQHVGQQPLLPETPQGPPRLLPSGYDFDNPEEKQQQQQFQQPQQHFDQQVQIQQSPLQPQHQQHFDQQVQIQQSPLQYQEHVQVPAQISHPVQTQGTFGIPGALPPGYDFSKPDNAEQAIAELHGQAPPSHPQPEQQQLSQPNYQTYSQQQNLPQQSLQQQPLQQQPLSQQPLQQQPLQQQPLPQQPLPQQHFVHSSPQHIEVAVQSHIQVGHNNAAVPDIVYGQPNIATPPEARSTYQADPAGYLPPNVETQPQPQQQQPAAVNYAAPVNVPQYQQPQIVPQQPVQQYNAAPQQQEQFHQHQQIHSLSSYMTTVQPYERYGDVQFTLPPRRPFDKYGPPPATTPLPNLQQQPFVDVAPMYRAPTTRPQAYAPSMTYTLNEQTKQQLQQFMPKEIQQHQQQQQQQQQQHIAAAPSTGKIRTVQIVNPNNVKTLKVLETSDHAGVKTIKILGPSNESPMGEHRIVKVVSQSGADGHESHVQTVKIYNDHQDVTVDSIATASATVETANNAYLPPEAAVNKKRLVRDSQHLQVQPRRFGGKGSNNRRFRQRL